jgi:hypothetical protein
VDGSASAVNVLQADVYDQRTKIGEVTDDTIGIRRADFHCNHIGRFSASRQKSAVPHSPLHVKRKDSSWYLAMNTTKDAQETPQLRFAAGASR